MEGPVPSEYRGDPVALLQGGCTTTQLVSVLIGARVGAWRITTALKTDSNN